MFSLKSVAFIRFDGNFQRIAIHGQRNTQFAGRISAFDHWAVCFHWSMRKGLLVENPKAASVIFARGELGKVGDPALRSAGEAQLQAAASEPGETLHEPGAGRHLSAAAGQLAPRPRGGAEGCGRRCGAQRAPVVDQFGWRPRHARRAPGLRRADAGRPGYLALVACALVRKENAAEAARPAPSAPPHGGCICYSINSC